MQINNVTVFGAGTLGGQVAFQTAFSGFRVVQYDISEDSLAAARERHRAFGRLFVKRGASEAAVADALRRITYSSDLAAAVQEADLTSESIPEDIALKKRFYRELAGLAPPHTIFTTNTSSFLPSDFAEASGRPARFLALHFANNIWAANVGEVMGHPGTDPLVYERVLQFAREIGMVPIPIKKEQNGYVLNTLLIPWLSAAMELVVNGVATPRDVDRTWMIGMRVAMGPFGIADIIGLETAYHVEHYWGGRLNDERRLRNAAFLKEQYVDRGNLGVKTGEGFYTYPKPKYQEEGFLDA